MTDRQHSTPVPRRIRLASHVRWIEHRGVPVLRQDFTGCSEAAVIAILDRLIPFVQTSGRTEINELVIVHGLKVTTGMIDAARRASEAFDHQVARTSVVGVRGAQHLILKLYNTFGGSQMHPFPTEEAALAWIVEQASDRAARAHAPH